MGFQTKCVAKCVVSYEFFFGSIKVDLFCEWYFYKQYSYLLMTDLCIWTQKGYALLPYDSEDSLIFF